MVTCTSNSSTYLPEPVSLSKTITVRVKIASRETATVTMERDEAARLYKALGEELSANEISDCLKEVVRTWGR